MHIQSGRAFASVYDTLTRLPSGLLLDVGAAVGGTTKKMRLTSPGSEVVAFEPNPANWPHFERRHGDDPMVKLEKAAVSDEPGVVRFAARHAISADDPRWAQYAGGSSIGRVQEDGEIEIPAVRLDDVLGDREALFCKIDVQGFEPQVIRGAHRAIRDRRIKIFQVEFMTYREIFPMLEGYACFDQEWSIIPRTAKANPPDLAAWDLGEGRMLSVGKMKYPGWPKVHPEGDTEAFMAFQLEQNARLGRCWVDLLFVAPDYLETYREAATLGR